MQSAVNGREATIPSSQACPASKPGREPVSATRGATGSGQRQGFTLRCLHLARRELSDRMRGRAGQQCYAQAPQLPCLLPQRGRPLERGNQPWTRNKLPGGLSKCALYNARRPVPLLRLDRAPRSRILRICSPDLAPAPGIFHGPPERQLGRLLDRGIVHRI